MAYGRASERTWHYIRTLSQTLSTGANPRLSTLRRIADVIGCKVGDFFLDELTTTDELEKIPIPSGTVRIREHEYEVILVEKKRQ